MMPDPNVNVIAAKVIEGQINNVVDALTKAVKGPIRKVLDALAKDLSRYTELKRKKCSYIKTPIINRDHPTFIYDIYVQTRLKVRKAVEADDEFIANMAPNDSIVIAGNAGSGKSMFMRHLFLKLCDEKRKKIPLFFELRDLNASEKKNLNEFLYYNLTGDNATITEQQFQDSLKAGVYTLILDGFDEINHDDRKSIEAQIRRLRDQCPDLQIIVSSRPDPDRRFESWQAFKVIDVVPMDMEQAAELIDRLEYDTKVKTKFLKAARDTLFHTHKTFLSNPLLCIMMLVTFEQTGHIPTKRHVFYEKAFDALFSIHDTAKEGIYKRKTYSNLSVDDFRNFMAAFCIVTYVQEQFVFTRVAFREALQKALALQRLTINIDDLTSDMIESTCLIQVEGTDYSFSHRSFQEYFAAVFISRSPAGGAAALLDNIILRANSDDVVPLAFAINRGLLEREWVIESLERWLEVLPSSVATVPDALKFVETNIGQAVIHVHGTKANALNLFYAKEGLKLHAIFSLYWHELFPKSKQQIVFWQWSRDDIKMADDAVHRMVTDGDLRMSNARKNVHRYVELTQSDENWLAKTTLVSAIARLHKLMKEILLNAKSAAQGQEDILAKLVRDGLPQAGSS